MLSPLPTACACDSHRHYERMPLLHAAAVAFTSRQSHGNRLYELLPAHGCCLSAASAYRQGSRCCLSTAYCSRATAMYGCCLCMTVTLHGAAIADLLFARSRCARSPLAAHSRWHYAGGLPLIERWRSDEMAFACGTLLPLSLDTGGFHGGHHYHPP
ncbi:hypothetical protein B296_00002161 [Ensete ventricosum]|uniref:Uncharacterized protein n=1 Tax=Ensete ventricosum TaxID=4639 RepID=A0A426Z389_ENSVE|nr:hypothetical protein B296_00002161 [Ensete ventricosum]